MYSLMCRARRRAIAAALLWAAAGGVPGAGSAQEPAREELLGIAREVVAGASFVSLATVDEDGHPAVRAMDPLPPEDDWVVWLATNPPAARWSICARGRGWRCTTWTRAVRPTSP